MNITAKADYAVRALLELAATADPPVKGEALARAQDIPPRFLEAILADLRRAGIVSSQRGADGGYRLARDAGEVSVADVIRAVEGPLADVHGTPPEAARYAGPAAQLTQVWIATRAALREVLETTTLAAIAEGELPEAVRELAARPDARRRRVG